MWVPLKLVNTFVVITDNLLFHKGEEIIGEIETDVWIPELLKIKFVK